MSCRSLKQLKKEVADKLAKKAAARAQAATTAPPPMPAGLYESESDLDMSPGLVSTKPAKVIAVCEFFSWIILTVHYRHDCTGC